MTLKGNWAARLALRTISLLRREHECGLPFVCGGLSGASTLLHGQAAVGLPLERADEFCSSERSPCVSTVAYQGQLGFGLPRGKKGSPFACRPSSLPRFHREAGVGWGCTAMCAGAGPFPVFGFGLLGPRGLDSTLCNGALARDAPHPRGRSRTCLARHGRWNNGWHSNRQRTCRVCPSMPSRGSQASPVSR